MKVWMLAFAFFFSFSAHAINLQKFHFSNSPVFATLEDGILSDGFITTDYKYILVGSYNYVRAPFIQLDNNEREKTIIEWMNTFNVGGAYRFTPGFQVGISSFFTHEEAIPGDDQDGDHEEKYVAGDTTIDVKYKLFERNRFAVSFTPRVYLATGNENFYTSNGETGYYFGFAFEKAFSFLQVALNLGHKENNGAKYDIVDHRRQFHFSVGALLPLLGPFDLTAEFYRDTPYDSDNKQVPNEVNVGLRYQVDNDGALFAGIGSGSTDESDSTDLRSYVGYKYFPSAREKSKKVKKEEEKYGKLYKLYDIFFDTGKSEITKTEKDKLDEMVDRFKEDRYISKIVIEGYTSKIGSKKWNKKLSEMRAIKVRDYLLAEGVDKGIVEIVAYGNEKADEKDVNKSSDRKVMFRLYRSR